MFADPQCVTCEKALQALERALDGMSRVRGLVISTAAPSVIASAPSFGTSTLETGHVDHKVAHDLYRTHTAPYFYVIDPAGIIRERGIANDETSVKRLLLAGQQDQVAIKPTMGDRVHSQDRGVKS
jgi:hypothetical protein